MSLAYFNNEGAVELVRHFYYVGCARNC